MKLFGAAMLRNEADVVESFVRHNLSLLDGLLVVDHGWSDGTSEILDALIAEGLPLEVERDGGPTTNTGRCAQTPVLAARGRFATFLERCYNPRISRT